MSDPAATRRGSLPRGVWLLGWTSLLTDSATEAIYPLLPVFLTQVLGAGALSLGVIEGVAEGTNSVLKLVSGRLSDRWRVKKPLVVAGYGLSSVVRPLIGLTTSWLQVLTIRFLDRAGKGIRGAPRDAMLAEFADATNRGRVFGFHRAMDHTGAVIGPLSAALFLWFLPGQYRLLFALTIVPGLVATGVLFGLPETKTGAGVLGAEVLGAEVLGAQVRGAGVHSRRGRLQPALGPPGGGPDLRRETASGVRVSWRLLPARLWWFFGVLLLFALGNSTDAFLLLRLSDRGASTAMLPLLWAGLHVLKATCSVYGGALSDRVGRRSVIAAGWCVYGIVYLGFALTTSLGGLVAWFILYGLYFGLAEGTEKALVADLAPAGAGGTAFGVYNAVIGLGALASSIVFGLLWKAFGAPVAFATGAALAGAATVLLMLAVPREPRPVA